MEPGTGVRSLGETHTFSSEYWCNFSQNWSWGASSFLESSVLELESGQSLRKWRSWVCSLESEVPSAKTCINWHWSAWDWSSFSSSGGRPSQRGHLPHFLSNGTCSVLTLEPAPLHEINNMFEAPEMLCSLAEKWCFMKCHPVQPSGENPTWPSLGTIPFIPEFWFHPLKTVHFFLV